MKLPYVEERIGSGLGTGSGSGSKFMKPEMKQGNMTSAGWKMESTFSVYVCVHVCVWVHMLMYMCV